MLNKISKKRPLAAIGCIFVGFTLVFCLLAVFWSSPIFTPTERFAEVRGCIIAGLFCLFLAVLLSLPAAYYDRFYPDWRERD
jgi:hypothetical protein